MNWLLKRLYPDHYPKEPVIEKSKIESITLSADERSELKQLNSIITIREVELKLMKHGLQNILRNHCKKHGLNEDSTGYDFEKGILG